MDIGLIRAQLDNGGRVITDEEANACLHEAERLVVLVLDYTPRRGPKVDERYRELLAKARMDLWHARCHVALR